MWYSRSKLDTLMAQPSCGPLVLQRLCLCLAALAACSGPAACSDLVTHALSLASSSAAQGQVCMGGGACSDLVTHALGLASSSAAQGQVGVRRVGAWGTLSVCRVFAVRCYCQLSA